MDKKALEQEIKNRIAEHLKRSQGSQNVHLLWKGYVAALLEWGLISGAGHDDLRDLLADIGDEEVREIFLGFPDEEDIQDGSS